MQTFEPVPYSPPSWATKTLPSRSIPSHRLNLARLPTPIHRWDLPGLPPGVNVYVKRDDQTEMQLSGNKIRKLEFILAEAKANGHDSVVTLGGIQSNHARATAVAASMLGLEPHLVLRTSRAHVDQDPGLVGNLLVERLVGAHIHLVTKEEYSRIGQAALGVALVAQLRAQGLNPYLIPVGGSNALGTWGYVEMMHELEQQLDAAGVDITDIAMACGSGGTTAGVALGNQLSGRGFRVTGYMVCDDERYFSEYIDGLFSDLGVGADVLGTDAAQMIRFVQAKGNGYAISRQEELHTVAEVATKTAVILDPVYTGKAVHAMLEEMRADPDGWRGRSVLFLHTGGLLGLYDSVAQLQQFTEGQRLHRMAVPAAS